MPCGIPKKTGLSKVLPVAASVLEQATTVKTGSQAGGGGSWKPDTNWLSWNDSPSSRWNKPRKKCKRRFEGIEEISRSDFSKNLRNRIKPRRWNSVAKNIFQLKMTQLFFEVVHGVERGRTRAMSLGCWEKRDQDEAFFWERNLAQVRANTKNKSAGGNTLR